MVSQEHKTLMALQLDPWRNDEPCSLLFTRIAPSTSKKPNPTAAKPVHRNRLRDLHTRVRNWLHHSGAGLRSPKKTNAPSSSST